MQVVCCSLAFVRTWYAKRSTVELSFTTSSQPPIRSRVPTAQGKQGKGEKNPCQGKHREFGDFAKTQGILVAQVGNSLILKVKDILAWTFPFISRSWKGLPVQFCVCNSKKSCKLAQGKCAVGQGKNRENTGNLKIQIEWVPWRSKPQAKIAIYLQRVSGALGKHVWSGGHWGSLRKSYKTLCRWRHRHWQPYWWLAKYYKIVFTRVKIERNQSKLYHNIDLILLYELWYSENMWI